MQRRLMLCLGAAFSGLLPLCAQAAEAPASSATSVSEVVVTANKREQSVLDVAGSVTTVDTRLLQDQGVHDLIGLAEVTPGLSFFSRGAAGANQVILRGLTSGSQQTSPTVGFYVNDTPFGFSIPVGGGSSILQPDIDPFDLDHVEILKGPQGTLYGASTLGGLIKYVTKAPNAHDFGGAGEVGAVTVAHGGSGTSERLALNVPIVEGKLGVRISGFDRIDPGFIDNTRTGGHDVNRTNAYGGRAAVGFYPTDDLSIVLSGLIQRTDTRAFGAVTGDPATLRPTAGDFTQQYFIDQAANTNYRLADAEVNWKFGGGYTLVSSTSASKVDLGLIFDFTNLLPPGFLGSTYTTGPQHLGYKKFAQEVRVVSPTGGPIEWIAGLYYTRENVHTATSVSDYTANGGPGPIIPLLSLASTTARYEEKAAFGNLTWNLTQALAVTGGVRVASNETNDRVLAAGALSGTALNAPNIQVGHQKETVATYLVTANWRYAPGSSFYVRAANGYRPGGPVEPPLINPGNVVVPTQFNSDSVWNYEIGGHSAWPEARLQADYSVFYIDWKDIQLPFLVNGFRVLSNGGGARSRGVEFDTRWSATQDLTLGLAGAFTDATLTSPAPLVFGHTGDRLPFVPRWSVSAHADYERPLSDELSLKLGAIYHYQSGVNSALSRGDTAFAALEGFSTVDIRGGLVRGGYSLDAYVRNLFDETAYVSGGNSGGRSNLIPLLPRTIGVSLRAIF
jgi:outer membrane receptor protein involved in Fe transport